MKKFSLPHPVMIVALLGIIFTSCSGQNESTSLSLTFNGSDFAQTSARDISVSSDYEGYYIVASVLGDYTETKSLKIPSSGTSSIEFDTVPVGAEISVEANVYKNYTDDAPYYHTFTGSSEKQKIYSGENTINLSMKNLVKNTEDPTRLSGDSSVNMGAYCFTGYKNGKYQVTYGSGSLPTILSEGIWNADFEEEFEEGTVVYFKEHAYRIYTSAEVNGPQGLSSLIIVEQPVWKSFTVKLGDQNNDYLEIGSTKVFE